MLARVTRFSSRLSLRPLASGIQSARFVRPFSGSSSEFSEDEDDNQITAPLYVEKLIGSVYGDSNAASRSSVGVGRLAPDWTADAALADKSIAEISLSDYAGKWLVFFFYPLDFTFVCPTEIIEFSEAADDFRAAGAEVVGASCDSEFAHVAWLNTPRNKGGLEQLNIPLVADLDRSIATNYNALLPDGSHPMRATYIIDPEGMVRHMSFNDPPAGRNVQEILRLVKAYQFADEHGEVCPVNWQPGSKTIKDDPVGKLEYFGRKD